MKTTKFWVQGMHCASCVHTITNTLLHTDGVSACEIQLVQKTATVTYDPEKISPEQMSQEIEKYGYTLDVGAETAHEHASDDDHSHDDTDDDHTHQHAASHSLQRYPVWLIGLMTGISFVGMIWMIGADAWWWTKYIWLHHFIHGLLPIFATIMLFGVGWKYCLAVRRYIQHGWATMDTLVGLGTMTAYLFSFLVMTFGDLWPDVLGSTVFFEAVVVVIWFVEIGRYLEQRVMRKTGDALRALLEVQAKYALVMRDGQEVRVPVHDVAVGDHLVIKAGEKVPVDGTILEGEPDVDESMMTGEPLPVTKRTDDQLWWGTIVTNTTVILQATAVGSETVLSKIIEMVEQAQASKPAIQRLVDVIMRYFIPSVLIIALLAGLFWLFWGTSFYPDINPAQFALMALVGVLVIACPCGLGLATPMAIMMWVGHGAKQGVLVKHAQWLLALSKASLVAFDKTGTITHGKPEVTDVRYAPWYEDQRSFVDGVLYALESSSTHPVADAVIRYLADKDLQTVDIDQVEVVPGSGVRAQIDNVVYTITKPDDTLASSPAYASRIEEWTQVGKTPFFLQKGDEVICMVAVADQYKPTIVAAVKQLQARGITPVMITWDHPATAQYIAAQVGIERVYAQVTPAQKAEIIQELQQEGKVVMVGDGINDAPALAQADIGVAVSTWSDVAIESAELTLLQGDIARLIKAIRVSRLTHAAIRQNLVWAFAFNLIGIPLAAWVFYPFLGVMLNPAFEGAAMAMSSLTVLLNTWRLQLKTI